METTTTIATTPMKTEKVFSQKQNWVFPKTTKATNNKIATPRWRQEGFFPNGFFQNKRFFPNRRLGFSKNKKARARPQKKKVFSQLQDWVFPTKSKARDGDYCDGHRKATGRPKEGHRIFPEGHRIFPKPQDVGGEN